MAYSKEQWNEAKFLWELDKPLSYIVEKTGISKGQISKKAKAQEWKKETKGNELKPLLKAFDKKKETLDQEKETLVSKLSQLKDYEITLLDKVIEEETGSKSLIFSTINLAVIRNNQLLTENQTYEKINVGDGVQRLEPRELNSADIKNIIESTDKASVTLGINQRHANTTINNTNANQQNNEVNNNLTVEFK